MTGRPGRSPLARWVDGAVAGRSWIVRAPLLGVLGYFFLRHLNDPTYAGVYAGLNLVLHEAGHALFSWSGIRYLAIAGGTLFEMACPLLAAVVFVRQRDAFAVPVCVFWLGTVFMGAAVYAGDARARQLGLVTLGGGPPEHDWAALLAPLGLLSHDRAVAAALRATGFFLMLGALLAGVWVLDRMSRAEEAVAAAEADEGASAAGGEASRGG